MLYKEEIIDELRQYLHFHYHESKCNKCVFYLNKECTRQNNFRENNNHCLGYSNYINLTNYISKHFGKETL